VIETGLESQQSMIAKMIRIP